MQLSPSTAAALAEARNEHHAKLSHYHALQQSVAANIAAIRADFIAGGKTTAQEVTDAQAAGRESLEIANLEAERSADALERAKNTHEAAERRAQAALTEPLQKALAGIDDELRTAMKPLAGIVAKRLALVEATKGKEWQPLTADFVATMGGFYQPEVTLQSSDAFPVSIRLCDHPDETAAAVAYVAKLVKGVSK